MAMVQEESRPTRRRIDDVGQKIGGARKDWATRSLSLEDLNSLTSEEMAIHIRKDNVWPQPDWQEMIANGADVRAMAMVKIIRDQLAARPAIKGNVTAEQARKTIENYVSMLTIVRDELMRCRVPDDVGRAIFRIQNDIMGLKNRNREDYEKYFSISKSGTADPLYLSSNQKRKIQILLDDGWPNQIPPWLRNVRIVLFGNKYCGARSYRVITPEFNTREDVIAYLEQQYRLKADREGAEKPSLPSRPHLKNLKRHGLPDCRHGRDISPEDFLETFGFRGVEFGNWLPDSERQQVLNLAYDALHDLAHVLGWPATGMSLDGRLALAFGARGNGKGQAHYEPGRKVVNVTRLSGAGALAHEFAHALDHWVGDLDSGPEIPGVVRSGSGWHGGPSPALPNLKPEEAAAWNRVMREIWTRPLTKQEVIESLETKRNKPKSTNFGREKSIYHAEAEKLNGRSGSYWTRPTEMFARAFEAAVSDALQERGAVSDYLVHGVEPERFAGDQYRGNPYPTGDERRAITSGILNLARAFAHRFDHEEIRHLDVDAYQEEATRMLGRLRVEIADRLEA